MIDTIKAFISKKEFANSIIPQKALIEKMTFGTVKKVSDFNDKQIGFEGMIANFFVRVTNDYIRLNGSLCKFLKGNNVDTLTTNEIKQALTKLSKLLGVQVGRGYLRRVDVGRNFELKNDAIDYFTLLKETPKYYRNIDSSTLKYFRGNYTLAFYDKGKEIEDKLMKVRRRNPDINKSNILRYELRLEGNVARRLQYSNAKVALLLSPTFLNKLNEKWFRHYKKIVKEKSFVFSDEVTSVKDLRTQIEVAGIAYFGGEDMIKQYLVTLSKKNNWSYKKVHDANKMIEKIVNTPMQIGENDLIDELDYLIENAYRVNNKKINNDTYKQS